MSALTLRSLARALRGEVCSGQVLAPAPGHSPCDRSLAVRLGGPDGFLVHSHAGDDWRACRDHVRDAIGLPLGSRWSARAARGPRHASSLATRTPEELRPSSRAGAPDNGHDADASGRLDAALAAWRATVPLNGTLAARYLAQRELDAALAGPDVRFAPSLPRDGAPCPAMVALIRDAATAEPCGVHRTFLAADAARLDKRMLGRAKGGVVMLTPDDAVTGGLFVTEGIETGLAALGRGLAPVWAALSTSGLLALPVLAGVEALTILADHDASGAGARAARALAERWAAEGREVRAVMPRREGEDWHDASRRAGAPGADLGDAA